MTTVLNSDVLVRVDVDDIAQNIGRGLLANAKARVINADQNWVAVAQNGDIGTFAHPEFTEFSALDVAATELRYAQFLATFGAAQRGATDFMIVVRFLGDAA
jgi:hypothetical protein